MKAFLEILKVIFLGIVEGITEWLPISSTGHMILVDQIFTLQFSEAFKEMFFVVIQLGAILAVVVLFWKDIWPFRAKRPHIKGSIIVMWLKIAVASIPVAIVGLLWEDWIYNKFYNEKTVAIALIVYGIAFLLIENKMRAKRPQVSKISQLSFSKAFAIGLFQALSVIPGTSRSGSTIIGARLLGLSRPAAARFTFFLAIPAMCGASLLKLLKFGFAFTGLEITALIVGMLTAFIVSLLVIRFLMDYVRRHDFKAFGIYRIILGVVVLIVFAIIK